MTTTAHGGSASMVAPDYWWYTARAGVLETVLASYVGTPRRVLDVGSADGPSVGWMRRHDGLHVTLDVDIRGLDAGGVCGSALALPFADQSFDVVGAFDVVEHCAPEETALAELARVLAPGGSLLVSVPAYQWAWTDFDVANGHHRRYTRSRAVRALEAAGLEVRRATYVFTSVFPLFAAERLLRRLKGLRGKGDTGAADIVELPQLPGWLSRLLLALCAVDQRVLRHGDLPFGSSVVVAATKPVQEVGARARVEDGLGGAAEREEPVPEEAEHQGQ
jgi:SAM-dependent methyltransferase